MQHRLKVTGRAAGAFLFLLLSGLGTVLDCTSAKRLLRHDSKGPAKVIIFRKERTATWAAKETKNVEVPFLINRTQFAAKAKARAKKEVNHLAKPTTTWLNRTVTMARSSGSRVQDQPRCGSATGVASNLCALCRYCCACNGNSPQCSSATVSVGGNVVMCSDCTGGTVAGTYFGDCGTCPQYAGSVCPGSSALCPGGDCCDGSSFVPALDYQCAT